MNHYNRKTLIDIIQAIHRRLGQIPPSPKELSHWSMLQLKKHARVGHFQVNQRKSYIQIRKDFA